MSADLTNQTPLDKNLEEVLSELTEETKKELFVALSETKLSSFSGPIPHPEILKGYKDVDPSFPERIISMAEREQKSRIALAEKREEESQRIARRGQIFGGILAMLIIISCVLLVLFGAHTVAIAIGTTTIIAISAIFVLQTLPSRR